MALEDQAAVQSELIKSRRAATQAGRLQAPNGRLPERFDSTDTPITNQPSRFANPLSQTPELQSSLQPEANSPREGSSSTSETSSPETEGLAAAGAKGAKGFAFDSAALLKEASEAEGIAAKFQALRTEAKRQAANAVKQEVKREVKRAVKSATRQALMAIVDGFLGSLDASTAGTTAIVDWMMYALTFGWLNVEMIYGSYIAGGKSKIIDPLIFPLPSPIDKKSTNLLYHLTIISIDVFLFLVLLPVMLFACVVLFVIAWGLYDPSSLIETFNTLGLDNSLFSILSSFTTL